MVLRVLVATCLLSAVHGESPKTQAVNANDDSEEFTEEDVKMLLDKLGDDDFADMVVNKMVDKLFSKLGDIVQPLDDHADDEVADEKSLEEERMAELKKEKLEDLREQQQRSAQDDEQQKTTEQQGAQQLYAMPAQDEDYNPWFALCTPGTLAASSLLGASLACVVFFVQTLIEMKFCKKDAEVQGYSPLMEA